MTENPIRALVQRIRPASGPFNLTKVVSLPLARNDCREDVADRARRWCIENCEAQWRPVERHRKGQVRIGFESIEDAVRFRLAF